MKIKAGAIIGVFLCSALLSSPRSYASEPARQHVVQRFPDSGDHELGPVVFVDKSKTAIGSLRLPALSDESRTEKRLVSFAEPLDTLRGLKGVMVFIEDIDMDVENHGLTKSLLKKEVESRLRQANRV